MKAKLIEDAIEEKVDLIITAENLRTICLEGTHLGFKSKEFMSKLRMLEDLQARVMLRLRKIRTFTVEEL